MELKEMIKVMTHYLNGGDVEYSEDCFKTIKGESNNKNRVGLFWDWDTFKYRIKEPKQKVTIEKWLCRDNNGYDVLIFETSNVDKHRKLAKIKFIESYEIEL